MPEGVIIGRIAIKVLPDTSLFRRETERDLNRIEQSINDVTVQLNADTRRALNDIDRAADKVRRDLDEASRIRVSEDAARTRAVIGKVDAKIGEILNERNIRLGVDPQTDRSIRRIEEKLEEIERIRATIRPEMDELARRKAERKIKDLKDQVDDIKSTIKPEVSEPFLLRAAARLAVLSRDRIVKLIPVVSGGALSGVGTALAALSGGRALANSTRAFKTFILNLDKSVPKIAAAGLAVTALAAGALTSAANLAALSSSLASIGGAGLALPGILGGIAVGLTVTIVALKDFKKQVPEVSAAWKQVKAAITENFWAKAQEPIREMIDSLLPEFVSGFARASTEIGGYFGSLASDIGSKLRPALAGMFRDLSKSVKVATGGTGALANIITVLGRTGAGYLPRLAKFFVDVSEKFSTFLAKAEKTGELKRFIDNGISALKDLGRVLKNVYNIFSGINDAAKAAGGSTLGVFANTLGKIAETVNKPAFKDTLTSVFSTAFDLIGRIGQAVGPALTRLFTALADTFNKLGPTIGNTLGTLGKVIADTLANPQVQQGIVAFFNGIASAVKALAPGIAALAPLFRALGEFIGNFAANLGPVFTSFIKAVTPALSRLLKALEPVADVLSKALVNAIDTLAPLLPSLADAFADFLTPIANVLPGIVKAILPAFVDLWKTLAPVAAPLGKAFADILRAVAPLVPQIVKLFADVLKPLVPVVIAALPGLVGLFKVLITLLSIALKLLTPFLKVINNIASIAGKLKDFFSGIAESIFGGSSSRKLKFTDEIEKTLSESVGNITRGTRTIHDLVSDVFGTTTIGAVTRGSRTVGDLINGVFSPATVGGVVGNSRAIGRIFGGTLTPAKAEIARDQREIQDILSGKKIRDAIISEAEKTARAASASARRLSRQQKADAREQLQQQAQAAGLAGRIAGEQAKNGYSQTANGIQAKSRALMRRAIQEVADAGGPLSSAGARAGSGIVSGLGSVVPQMGGIGSAIMGGLISGIDSRRGELNDKLGAITKDIPKHKGPKKVDKVLLLKSGQYIMESLIKGLDSRVDAMRDKLRDITDEIGKIGNKGVRAFLLKKVAVLGSKFGPYETVVKQVQEALEALRDLQTEAVNYRNGIRDAIIGAADVTQFRNFEGSSKTSIEAIIKGLTKARDEAKRFAAVIAALKKAGLNQTAIDQLAQAGAAGGLASAEALFAAGKAGIAQVNKLQSQIASAAGSVANTAMESMYRAGLNAAEGLLAGLRKRKRDLEKSMAGLADALVKAFKSKLKIKSPSRVFKGLGSFVGEGLLVGLESQYASVHKSLARFSDSLAGTQIDGPSVSLTATAAKAAYAAYGAPGSSSGGTEDHRQFHYHAPPGSASLSAEEELFAAVGRPRFGW